MAERRRGGEMPPTRQELQYRLNALRRQRAATASDLDTLDRAIRDTQAALAAHAARQEKTDE